MLQPLSSSVVTLLVLSLAIAPVGGHRAPSGQVRAAGGPLVDCTGGPSKLARLERGMPVQREALRRAEEALKAAQEGNLQALKDRASADIVRSKVNEWLADQQTMLAEAAASRLTGVPVDRVAQYRQKLEDWKSAVEKVQKSGRAGYAAALRENAAAMKDFMKVLEFLDDSGIGEEAARTLARAAFGPVGDKAIDGFNLARDWTLAELQQNISDQELGQLRDTYYGVLGAVMNNHERIENLRGLLASCRGASKPEVQESPKPIPPEEASAPAPPETKEKKMSAGKRLAITMAVMTAVGGTGLIVSQSLDNSDGLDDGSGSGGGGGSPTIVDKHEPWICSGSRCTGRLTIDFPVVMNSGTITVGTDSLFLGQKTVNPAVKPGRVTFDMEKSPNLSCPGPQTSVGIWNGPVINTGPAAYTLRTSIRVECR